MSMLQPKQPLWMPKGSVRAILALLIVAPIALIATLSGINLTAEDYKTIVLVVLGYYFIQKAATSGSDKA